MPEKRFVRRRNIIPDQSSAVSTQEQARLLNDPVVPIETVHTTTTPVQTISSEITDSHYERKQPINRTKDVLLAKEEAA